MLNRLGVCASADTLARFIQHKVSSDNSVPPALHPESFTIVSADNIDFLHSYARVFKGSKNSSWHGTSVQAVQPLPSLSIHSEVHTQDTDTTANNLVIPPDTATVSRFIDLSNVSATSSLRDSTPPLLEGQLFTASCFLPDVTTSSSDIKHHSRKRLHRSSPIQSPLKLTRSPAPKQRRFRTGTEEHIPDPLPEPHFQPASTCRYSLPQVDKSLSDFLLNEQETVALNDLYGEVNTYMLLKLTIQNTQSHDTLSLNLQDYYSITRTNHTEKSNIQYLQVMDAKADSKDTLMVLLHDLHSRYVVQQGRQYLVVTGDDKVYELLQSLKFEYGEDLHWLIPYPGDFHLLMNYQSALMKPYFDAGLKSLAEAAGYPVAAIRSCSQFKRTHHFILEAWEALYQVMLAKFLKVSSIYKSSDQSDDSCDLQDKILKALETLKDQNISEFPKAFNVMLANTRTLNSQSVY